MDCYLISKDNKFLEYAEKLNNWILTKTLEDDGTVKPVRNLDNEKFEIDKKVWYKKSECLHVKLTIPFLRFYKITNNKKYIRCQPKKNCKLNNLFQQSDETFYFIKITKSLICLLLYAFRELIHTYNVTKDETYLNSCKKQ